MTNNVHIGNPVIDELRLCYIGEPQLLDELTKVEVGCYVYFGDFFLIRGTSDRYEFYYSVYGEVEANVIELGEIKFGRYGSYPDSRYVYYRINNPCLYSKELLKFALDFPIAIGLFLNNITSLDIAIDYQKNVSSIIKRMLRDERITTILNGKVIKERTKTIPEIMIDYSTSLNRLKCPTITIKQAKATKNKRRGVSIQSYDKKAEIVNSSNKKYILDYYGSPRYLFRLEVRLQYQELKDYLKSAAIALSEEIFFDQELLRKMYYYHLSSVLRFRKGRNVISWDEMIECAGKV